MKKWLINNPFVILLVPLVAFILCCTYLRWPMTLEPCVPISTSDTAVYTVHIQSLPQDRPRTWRYEAEVLAGEDTHPRIILSVQKDSLQAPPQLGDTLLVYTCLQQPDSISGFDYATYLHRQGISATAYVDHWSWNLIGSNQTPWWHSSIGWQQRLVQRYQQLGIEGRELATLSALTLGYREDMDAQLQHQFAAAGAMHVLAVSGLHTGILMLVLMAVLTLFGLRKPLYEQRGRRIALGVTIMVLLVGYAFLTGCTPSVVRSVIMCCMILLAQMTNRSGQMLNAIFGAAFFILIFRPMDLFSVSFQLSFAAVISIALFAQGWRQLVPPVYGTGMKRVGFWVLNYVVGLLGMTTASMIGTMPVSLYYFGQISNFFMLTNLIVLPLAWLMMVGGLLTLTIGWIMPIGKVLAWLLNGCTWAMNESVGWLESLPYATTMVSLSGTMLVVLIVVNLGILVAWKRVTTK